MNDQMTIDEAIDALDDVFLWLVPTPRTERTKQMEHRGKAALAVLRQALADYDRLRHAAIAVREGDADGWERLGAALEGDK